MNFYRTMVIKKRDTGLTENRYVQVEYYAIVGAY